MLRQISLMTFLLALISWVSASDLVVLGLFRDMAILEIDGKQYKLRAGESTPQGIKLITADSEEATFEIDGEQQTYKLGSRISSVFTKPDLTETTIYRRNDMYFGAGSINGHPVKFIVDTGASAISMNEAQAKRIGIDFRYKGNPVYVSTANGVVKAYQVNLDRVKVGNIQLRHVTGIVHEGDSPAIILLGMSFLNQLDMRRDGDKLVLKKKW